MNATDFFLLLESASEALDDNVSDATASQPLEDWLAQLEAAIQDEADRDASA